MRSFACIAMEKPKTRMCEVEDIVDVHISHHKDWTGGSRCRKALME